MKVDLRTSLQRAALAAILLSFTAPVWAGAPTGVGQEVRANGSTNVRSAIDGDIAGIQPAGALGTIVEGPTSITVGDALYSLWKVDWASGPDGWCPEAALEVTGRVVQAPENPTAPKGSALTKSTSAFAAAPLLLPDKQLRSLGLPAGTFQLWQEPKETVGNRLAPESAAHSRAENEGQTPKGRVARLDLATVAPMAALKGLTIGARVVVPGFKGETFVGKVNTVVEEGGWVRVGGELSGKASGSFMVGANGKAIGGWITPNRDRQIIYEVKTAPDGSTELREKSLAAVLCLPMPREPGAARPAAAAAATSAETPPVLDSRPSATAVLYLDMDGETVTNTYWNVQFNGGAPIVASAPSLTSEQMALIWEWVSEDFRPFNISVTTDPSRYANAPVGKRMRVIVTPSDEWYDPVGGVAWLDSFAEAGTGGFAADEPCWVFNSYPSSIAEAISHEFGHTLGLSHDGDLENEYYEGHGTSPVSWGPIMGASYLVDLVQWSKGEYKGATNKENDVAIISNAKNGFGYVPDEDGGTRATAAPLNVGAGQTGIITSASDSDFYSFTTPAGSVTVTASPAQVSPNLDLRIELQDSAGSVLAWSNPDRALDGSFTVNLVAGTYYVRIFGVGRGSVFSDGYSNYGSLGPYTITTSLPGSNNPPVVTSSAVALGVVGKAFSYQITATNSPTSYDVVGTLPEGLSLDALSGLISGTPVAVGTSVVQITATNPDGTGSKTLSITINNALTLADALDATGLTWQTQGDNNWIPQTTITHDGSDAARSGAIGGNQQSALYTTVSGPATVNFYWKVDSEQDHDILDFVMDSTVMASISGSVSWHQKTFTVPAGTHVLWWIYSKDASTSSGADTGFVDQVEVTAVQAPPVITSPNSANGTVDEPFSYQIAATNNPTSYAVTGTLPDGLALDAATGLISGTPTTAGSATVTIQATNAAGTGNAPLTLTIHNPPSSIAEAVDAEELTWTSGGNAEWVPQVSVTADGVDAARSGVITDGQKSWVRTTVNGPKTLTFRWKVSSEAGWDFFSFRVDGAIQARIAGEKGWTLETFEIPAGSHTLEWSYEKDATYSSGSDRAWLDTVVAADVTRTFSLAGDLNFGSVAVGDAAQRTFTITNTSANLLTITGIDYPAGFSGAWAGTIPSGATRTITVTFAPATTGPVSGFLTVHGDQTGGGNTLAVSGNGEATAVRDIALSGDLSFGTVGVGTSVERTLTIANKGNAPLTISGIVCPSGFSGNWTGTIQPGSSVDVAIVFTPLTAGSHGGSLTVQSDATDGTGTHPCSGSGTLSPTRTLVLEGDLNFGDVIVGQSAQKGLTIRNAGTASLTVTGITVPAPFGGNWSGTIQPGQSQVVPVTFSPSVAGSFGGALQVQSNATSGTASRSVTGTGTLQTNRIMVLTGDLNFGSIPVATTAQRDLVISNPGAEAITITGITYPAGFSGAWSGTIGPGSSQTVPVTFAPLTNGTFGGSLTVAANSTSGTRTLPVSGSTTGTTVAAAGLPGNIPDRGVANSSLVVTGQPSSLRLNEIRVNLAITHPDVGDLIVKIKPPHGGALTLHKRKGNANGLTLSGQSLPSSRSINPNGSWKITVQDKVRGSTGTLQSWSLDFP